MQLDPIIIQAILDRIGEENTAGHDPDICPSCQIRKAILNCPNLLSHIAVGCLLLPQEEMFVLGFLIASEYYSIKHLEDSVVTTPESK